MIRSSVLVALCVLLQATPAAMSQVPLTDGLGAGTFLLTPDASHIVFQDFDSSANLLYSARTDGAGSPIPISPAGGGGVTLFQSRISPDSAWILYNRDEHIEDRLHVSTLASRIDGSTAPVLLNTSRVYDDDTSAYNLGISPDSRYALIRADQGDESFDLLSRRIDGSSPAVPLNGAHGGSHGDGVGSNWSIAGERAVFQTRGGEEGPGFFSRHFDGSTPIVRLSPSEPTGLGQVSADGSTIVFSIHPASGPPAIYSNSTAGGELRPLPFDTSSPYGLRGLSISPNGDHAILLDNEFRLSTAPSDGSGDQKVFGPFSDGTSIGLEITPDSTRIAYLMRPGHHGDVGLFVSAIDGSGVPKQLSPPPPAGRQVRFGNFMFFSSDSRYLVFISDQISDGEFDLFSVPTDGSSLPTRLSDAADFKLTPDGRWVIAALNPNADFYFDEIVAIPIEGGEAVPLADSPYLTGGIREWQLSQDGAMLVYLATSASGVSEIFAVAIPEPGAVCWLVVCGMAMTRRRVRVNLP